MLPSNPHNQPRPLAGVGWIHLVAGQRWLARIADCEYLPLVTVGLVPVDHASSVFSVDLHVHWAADRASVLDAGSFDAPEDCVEVLQADAEAEVIDRKGLSRLDEVEGQTFIDVDRRERANPSFCPGDSARTFAEATL